MIRGKVCTMHLVCDQYFENDCHGVGTQLLLDRRATPTLRLPKRE